MTKPINHTARFETVCDLYYLHSGRLRPGKDSPSAMGHDSSSPENSAAFDEWMATTCFGAALDRIAELEAKVEQLDVALDEDRGLPECIVPGCEAVAAHCAEHIRKGELKAWRVGWYAGSGGEALTANPFMNEEDANDDKEDPRIVGYERSGLELGPDGPGVDDHEAYKKHGVQL